jgi:protein phosphatase
VHVAYRSELGYVRTRNEDATFVGKLPDDALLVVVADGMGGHPAGDVASRIAVDTIKATAATFEADPADELTEMLRAAHGAVLAAAAQEPAYDGMGTTAVVSYVTSDRAHVAHVGDSRCYLVRDHAAVQLTHDHNQNGYLTQALGIARPIEPERVVVDIRDGDRLLLCTDGLSGLVPETAIGELAATGTLSDACDRLVDAALNAGGYDNVTVALVEA